MPKRTNNKNTKKNSRRRVTKKVETPWVGLPEGFSSSDYYGFVYLITNLLTGQKYVGRKYFTKKVKRKRVESDWRYYRSSCDSLKADINKYGLESFKFEILHFCETRAQTNYTEVREQFIKDVLYSKVLDQYEYYNTNILARYFRGHV